jgi:hypothetical protein
VLWEQHAEDVASEEPAPGLVEGSGGREIFMRSEEAQIGKRVRVRKDHRTANWQGREGTIAKRWGNPCYIALDVLFDDGNWQLFWYHELEEIDSKDRGARRRIGASAAP